MSQVEPLRGGPVVSISPTARQSRLLSLPVGGVKCKPAFASLLIALTDMGILSFALAASAGLRHAFGGDYPLSLYWHLLPLLALFPMLYALFGLYPAIVYNPVIELRRLSAATTMVFLILSVMTFLLRVGEVYSRLVFFGAWSLALILVPLARSGLRLRLAKSEWWGYPTAVFGAGETGRRIVHTLLSHPELGFRLKAIIDIEQSEVKSVRGVPVYQGMEDVAVVSAGACISHAILAMPELPRARLLAVLESQAQAFPHLFIVPDLDGLSSLGIETRDLCRQLTLEVRRSLLLPGPQIAKRVMDVTVATLSAVPLLPVMAVIYLLLKLGSSGPALYYQTRIGRGGKIFRIWKFRSMVHDAQTILEQHLAQHPELREEWERDHKLKNDPRITRLGRFLRKTSLDELPQLWNVVRGDMSLVGPRPIVQREVAKYGEGFCLYKQVLPGITGMWQVSGRNDTSYNERVSLDAYYVRNWSPWLDIYLLSRTVRVVLAGSGAY